MADVKTPKRTRREQAAQTRERIVEAAIAEFVDAGYTGARMADIAQRAGVAVQTVYFVFHTKPELLQACYEHAVLGPDKVPPPARPFYREALTARTGRAALRALAAGNAEILARAAAIDAVAAGATHEPEALEVRSRSEDLRRRSHTEVVRHLDETFGLREDVDVEHGTDLLMTLAGQQVYLTLTGYGWPRERYVDWLADALATQLLARPGRRPGTQASKR